LVQREEIQKRLGARIRKLRREGGWTQDEFADISGLHRAQVGAFENGRMNITLASLHLVAETLGVRIIDLFKGVKVGNLLAPGSPQVAQSCEAA
jgi:transcriptional regulator with XRE-family HTH domain